MIKVKLQLHDVVILQGASSGLVATSNLMVVKQVLHRPLSFPPLY